MTCAQRITPTAPKEGPRVTTLHPPPGLSDRVRDQALGSEFVAAALRAVAAFDSFDADNDPHGEHDFGSLEVDGRRLFWKIDWCAAEARERSVG